MKYRYLIKDTKKIHTSLLHMYTMFLPHVSVCFTPSSGRDFFFISLTSVYTHCRCTGWSLHLITLNDRDIHTHTHTNIDTHTPHSVGLLWASDRLVAETPTWQHPTLTTDRHPCSCWIRTHHPSKRAVTDLRLGRRGHWIGVCISYRNIFQLFVTTRHTETADSNGKARSSWKHDTCSNDQ